LLGSGRRGVGWERSGEGCEEREGTEGPFIGGKGTGGGHGRHPWPMGGRGWRHG
jgi:hypothetical protein